MLRNKNNIWIVVFLLYSVTMNAQVIKSEKSAIWIDNKPVIIEVDKAPPIIKIISPEIVEGSLYTTETPEISLMGKIIDESGISYAAVNSKLVEVSEEGMFVTNIFLYEGNNEIKIIAVDKENNLQKQTIIIEYSKPIVTLADRISMESTYYGLIIGINQYDDPNLRDLDNPINDAQKLYDVLTTEYTFEKENITFLENASLEEIMTSFESLSEKITDEDNLLIFYAGHGWWDKDANTGFWLPADSRQDSKVKWFRNSTLVDYMKELNTKHTLLIADACFSGAIFKTRSAMPEASKAVEKLYELPSREAMTSGTLTEVPDRSVFMKYLVERLDKNEEKYLSSEILFSSFSHAVINNSDVVPQYGEIQNVGDEGGDFIFIRK